MEGRVLSCLRIVYRNEIATLFCSHFSRKEMNWNEDVGLITSYTNCKSFFLTHKNIIFHTFIILSSFWHRDFIHCLLLKVEGMKCSGFGDYLSVTTKVFYIHRSLSYHFTCYCSYTMLGNRALFLTSEGNILLLVPFQSIVKMFRHKIRPILLQYIEIWINWLNRQKAT